MYKNLCNLIEEASRLDKELKKMSPEKQMETLRKLNSANFETFQHYYPRFNPNIDLALDDKYKDDYHKFRTTNYLFHNFKDNIDLNKTVEGYRVGSRKMNNAMQDFFNKNFYTPVNQLDKDGKRLRRRSIRQKELDKELTNDEEFLNFKNFGDSNKKYAFYHGGSYNKLQNDIFGNRADKFKGVNAFNEIGVPENGFWVHQVPISNSTKFEDIPNKASREINNRVNFYSKKAYSYGDIPAQLYGVTTGDNLYDTNNGYEKFITADDLNNKNTIAAIEKLNHPIDPDDKKEISTDLYYNQKERDKYIHPYLNDETLKKLKQAEEEAQRKAEEEAQRKAKEEAKKQAALEAQRQAEAERRAQTEAKAQRQAEAERRAQTEAKKQAALEAQRQAEAERRAQTEAKAQLEKQMARAEAERRKQTTQRHAKERHEQRPFYQPYMTKAKRYFRTHPNAKYAAAGLGGLGAAGLSYGAYNALNGDVETPETPDHIHELLGAL